MEESINVIDLTEDCNIDSETHHTPPVCKVMPFYMLKSYASSACTSSPQLELSDIIYGKISSIMLMTFCIDIEFLISACSVLRDVNIPVCLLHGKKGTTIADMWSGWLKLCRSSKFTETTISGLWGTFK